MVLLMMPLMKRANQSATMNGKALDHLQQDGIIFIKSAMVNVRNALGIIRMEVVRNGKDNKAEAM